MNGGHKNIVIGTAGHIDHGKTSLIKAVTGIDTDRLKEEKERGMTIEPGFANLELPSGKVFSVVDVPGHERFIKNMVRGVSGIDIVILVVASDDGVMPQTREHLDILRLLNVQYGLIVISKVDLVNEEIVHMAAEEVRSLVRGTFLENAPVMYFSARTGQGTEEIRRSIEDMSEQVRKKDGDGIFRMPIDRVFTMAGYGTIVTGTVVSGTIKKGNAVHVYPSDRITVARNIQIHGKWVGGTSAGHRAGVNLSNVKVEDLTRGMVLGEPRSMTPTYLINASFHYLHSNSHPLHNRTRVRFYSGTSEIVVRMILMEKEKLYPGETCYVQLRLEDKATLLPYDRFIIRTLSPMNTIGGGMALEIHPGKYRSARSGTVEHMAVLERRNNLEIVEAFIRNMRFAPVGIVELAGKLHLPKEEVRTACDHLLEEGRILVVGNDSVLHKESYERLKADMLEKTDSFHAQHPSQKDASQEEIRSRVSHLLSQRLFEAIVQELKQEGKIEITNGRIKRSGFQAALSERHRHIYKQLDDTCRRYGFRPLPSDALTQIKGRFGDKDVEDALSFLIGEKRIIRLNNNRLIHSEAVREIKERLKTFIEKKGRIALSDSMELLGLGRTQVRPIYDYLDAIRFTIRIGDHRVLYKGAGEAQDKSMKNPVR